MYNILSTAGLAEAVFLIGALLSAVVGVGVILGIAGISYALLRPGGKKAVPISFGLFAVGTAVVFVWGIVQFNSHDISGFFQHMSGNPVIILMLGVPFVLGVLSLGLGFCRIRAASNA